MFILRIIEEVRDNESLPFDQVIENFELGASYSKLKNGHTKEFDRIMAENYPETNPSEVDALVIGDNGMEFFIQPNTPLREYSYFIMSESGKTLERITATIPPTV